MYTLGPQVVVFCSGHESLRQSLIDNEDYFGCHLGTKEVRFLKAVVFPFGKVLGHLGKLDASWRLAVANMLLLLLELLLHNRRT